MKAANAVITTLQGKWNFLIGDPKDFPMEHRALNAIILISEGVILASTIVNFALGLELLGFITLAFFILLVPVYYLSRFRKVYVTMVFVFSAVSYVTVGVAFFFNSGTQGPVLYLYLATFVLLLAVTPRKQQVLWIVGHLLTGSLLIYTEYAHPQIVAYTYSSREARFMDIYFGAAASLMFIWLLISYLRKNYVHEKNLAQQRAIDLAEGNEIIQDQNTKLQALIEEKDKLFSIISHDLRGPLGSIKALLQIMDDEELPETDKKEIEQDLLQLTNNTYLLLDNLLHWSSQKVQGEGHQLNRLSLKGPIEDCLDLLRPAAKAKSVSVRLTGTPDIHALGNSEMLSIVIRNLLSNAIKFTPPDGIVHIHCTSTADHVYLSVKDSGIGIPEEKQKNLFSARQTSSYGTQNESGAGLGLVLCKEYITRMNGSIDFSSDQNQGTEFCLKLPRNREQQVS